MGLGTRLCLIILSFGLSLNAVADACVGVSLRRFMQNRKAHGEVTPIPPVVQRIFDQSSPAVRRLIRRDSFLIESRLHLERMERLPAAARFDLPIEVANFEEARNLSYFFPVLEEFGFGFPNAQTWTRTVCRLSKSRVLNRNVGWEITRADGTFARVRLDYDPVRGAHYNIEMTVRNGAGRTENHNVAVLFKCAGQMCTEDQFAQMVMSQQ
jgi:hypothetical protein